VPFPGESKMALTMTGVPDVSFVIPTKRPSQLNRCIEKVKNYARLRGYQIEILICGEVGSFGQVANVQILSSIPNDKGTCIRAGVLASHSNMVVICDDDFPVTFSDLDRLLGALSQADIALGNRYLEESVFLIPPRFTRRLASAMFRFLVRAFFGFRGFDTQCGVKAIRREKALVLFANQTTRGYVYDVELVVRAIDCGLRVAQIPLHWKSFPESTISVCRVAPSMMKGLLLLRLLRSRTFRGKVEVCPWNGTTWSGKS